MKKSDLKVGYVVKMRNGKYRMVMNHSIGLILVGDGVWHELSEHNEDLTLTDMPELDIVKVYDFPKVFSRALSNDGVYRDILWKRPEKTFLSDFKEKYPNAPLRDDGTPAFCPNKLGYTQSYKCDELGCKHCWSRPLEEV